MYTMTEEDDIELVKRNLDLERIISSQASDWESNSVSNDVVGRCTHPTHGHTSDSNNAGNMVVFDDGAWWCFSHESGGDVLDWIAVEEGVTRCRDPHPTGDEFVETLRVAADRAGVELSNGDVEMEELPDDKRAEIELCEVIEHLHSELDSLIDGQTVRRYIKDERGFTDAEIDNAKIGWIDDQVYADLLHEFGNETLQRTGFQTADGKQHISERIVYPYLRQGRPKYWTARASPTLSKELAKYQKPKGDSPLEQPIHRIRPPNDAATGPLWLVEGIQDSISVSSKGGVKACTGVGTNLSLAQRQQLLDLALASESVVVCFDNDDSGRSKAIKLALELMDEGVDTNIGLVPEGGDPNDHLSSGGAFDEIETLPAAEFIIDERGDDIQSVRQILRTVEPGTLRADNVVAKVADLTDFTKPTLHKEVRKHKRTETQSQWKDPIAVRKSGRVDPDYILEYGCGTEIELPGITSRTDYQTFKKKYAAHFNYVPTMPQSDFHEIMNGVMREVGVEEASPLSEEGRCIEHFLESIADCTVVENRENVTALSQNTATLEKGGDELWVPKVTYSAWIEDFGDIDPATAAKYTSPIRAADSEAYKVGDRRVRFWRFDVDEVEDRGYLIPEPQQATPDDSMVAGEEFEP